MSIVIPHETAMINKIGRWLSENTYPVSLFLVTRAGLFFLVYLGLILIPLRPDLPWQAYPNNLFLDGWLRWDSGWYYDIARNGYSDQPQNELGQSNAAFFPLYPLLIRAATFIVPNFFLAGLLISNLALLVALIVLFHLVTMLYNAEVARRSLVLFLVYPFSFYFSAMYSESLFLLTIVLSFYLAEQGKWGWAALFAAAAGATRLVGILMVVGLFVLYLEKIVFDWGKIRPNILWIPLGLLGPLSFMGYLSIHFGNPFLAWESQFVSGWGTEIGLTAIINTIRSVESIQDLAAGQYAAINLIHLTTFVVALMLTLLAWRRPNKAYTVWAILTLLVSFSLWRSMGRLAAVVFPVFIIAALSLKESQYQTIVYISILFLALLAILHAHFYWVS